MKARALFALVLACAAMGCLGAPTEIPPCMPQYHVGDRLSVRLGVPYGAASEYWYESSFAASSADTCNAVDGLASGVVVTFIIDETNGSASQGCEFWTARFEPEPQSSDPPPLNSAWAYSVEIPDKTIAHSDGGLLIDDRPARLGRTLFTPSGHTDGVLVPRELPPLAVSRSADWDSSGASPSGGCFDFWVATLEPAP